MQVLFVFVLSFVGIFSQSALSSPLEERQAAAQCLFSLGTSAVRNFITYRTIWLNPDPMSSAGSGSSEIP